METDRYYIFPQSRMKIGRGDDQRWSLEKRGGKRKLGFFPSFEAALEKANELRQEKGGAVCYLWRPPHPSELEDESVDPSKMVIVLCPRCWEMPMEWLEDFQRKAEASNHRLVIRDCGVNVEPGGYQYSKTGRALK